jgi:hypothetical protein
MTQLKIFLELRPPQVEMAMAKAQFLCSEFLSFASRDWNCRSFGRPDKFHGTRAHLDIPGIQVGIPHLRRPEGDFALDDHHALLAEAGGVLDLAERGPLWVERNLDDAGSIAQIEEDDSAQIS